MASVHSPQAAPANAARDVDGDLIQRTDRYAASVVNKSIVGSWSTKDSRVTSRGFVARNRAPPVAQARDEVSSKRRKNPERAPTA